jgi:cyclopropane-fatty-acyl-phospholipid synthase
MWLASDAVEERLMTAALVNPGASREAIQTHYDLEARFWRLWIGETMTYSCALWEAGDTLDDAQRRKLDWHANEARVGKGSRVLDVGCGWGALMRRLVERHGAKEVVGVTLSPAQVDYVRDLGVPGIRVRGESWSEHQPAAPYDAIISMGAFEHFAQPGRSRPDKIRGYRDFFASCHGWLKSGGRLSLQTIIYGNMLPEDQSEFLKREIYPESELPYLDEILESCRGYFEVVGVRNDRHDYARTCRAWLEALRGAETAATELVGSVAVRRYQTYLRACIVGFELGNTGLARITLARNERPRAR